ncbi:MAG: glycosyltransferase [Hydrogenophaga sp.]|jgi:glycosyltransferase involved in cell wall biosynthesis|uniref:glycosyltransferase n=1 Tax=Hydrogenophaga sp. TaxID=1904254 RepID=UPI001D9BB1D0|nr:glycosyltransferase family 2 protein [Hydrogenophaga sp.]MBW0172149.1 glycosyltransferase family 2 protein [Hydrogenophaga sp.]MBW0186164.1 glycosyltransferase family 2 protein [Hydrogenophaga sp.]
MTQALTSKRAAHGLAIIVPANNEEAYLAACLRALFGSDPVDTPVQVLVVANACTDRTVDVARSFESAAARIGWDLQVIDLAQPGKLNALNVGDDTAAGELRLYLDADVLVSPSLIRMLVEALSATEAPLYASGSPRIAKAQSSVTRAYARFWQMLPFAQSEAPGFGAFAVNAAGRSRWGKFPDIISDDTYVRLLFAPHERKGVTATYEWPMVEGFSRLVKVRRRQDQGVKEIAEKWPHLLLNEGKMAPTLGMVLGMALRAPWGFVVYAAVTLAVRSRRASSQWTRGR